ncbi:MAG TPA: hypothetical protein DGC76_12640, partial [Candidatus Accumulibacter sp.]|nr:hypothetical protein [Accumulibacter sp.]
MPQAASPLPCKRLGVVVEANEDARADLRAADFRRQFEVELEQPLQRPQAFRIAWVGGMRAAAG